MCVCVCLKFRELFYDFVTFFSVFFFCKFLCVRVQLIEKLLKGFLRYCLLFIVWVPYLFCWTSLLLMGVFLLAIFSIKWTLIKKKKEVGKREKKTR